LDDDIRRAGERVADTERRVSEQIARTGPVLGRASSVDGAVSVVTAPGAPPQRVLLSRDALSRGPDALAAEIVRVAGLAARDASARMHRTLERVVDPDQLTRLGFPPGDPRDDEPQGSFLRGPR
jgi:hypothetical protein